MYIVIRKCFVLYRTTLMQFKLTSNFRARVVRVRIVRLVVVRMIHVRFAHLVIVIGLGKYYQTRKCISVLNLFAITVHFLYREHGAYLGLPLLSRHRRGHYSINVGVQQQLHLLSPRKHE